MWLQQAKRFSVSQTLFLQPGCIFSNHSSDLSQVDNYDHTVFNAICNIISVLSPCPKHPSMFSWSSFLSVLHHLLLSNTTIIEIMNTGERRLSISCLPVGYREISVKIFFYLTLVPPSENTDFHVLVA